MLDRAIQIAVKAHAQKVNRSAEPEIFHSFRLMMSQKESRERICGVLHDVAGMPGFSLDALRKEGFGEDVILALDCLQKRPEESHEDWDARVLKNETATKVRLADLEDEIEYLGKKEKTREYTMLKEAVMAKKKLSSRALQAIETKKRIISCGKKLIQSEGFENVSVHEISKNAGITVGTFYYYFNSKDELLYEMLPKMSDYFKSDEAQQMKKEGGYARLMNYFAYLINYPFLKYRDVMKHILASQSATDFIDSDRLPAIREIIREGQEDGEFETDVDAAQIAQMLFYANRGVFGHFIYHAEDYDYPDVAYQTVSRLAFTFLTGKGKESASKSVRGQDSILVKFSDISG
jgi:AcrR family transcriptional regulator